MDINSTYIKDIQNRSKLRFIKGLYPRFKKYLINKYIVWTARKNGATIGEFVTMPYKLAKSANFNLIVGNHSSIQTHLIGLSAKVKIGNNVIIGSGVEIIVGGHNFNSVDFEADEFGIEIEDYCWLATRAFILPSCRRIGYGAICAAGSVVTKNVKTMSIVNGNPAELIIKRDLVHTDLCVESLLGNDFVAYKNAFLSK